MKHTLTFVVVSSLLLTACGGGGSSDETCYGGYCHLSGRITQDFTLTAGTPWLIQGNLIVGTGDRRIDFNSAEDIQSVIDSGVTLTIEPGSEVIIDDEASLIVTRGSRLTAEGTAEEPITFSTLNAYDWGYSNVVISGFSDAYTRLYDKSTGSESASYCSQDTSYCNSVFSSNDILHFGGQDNSDNSGSLRYVNFVDGVRFTLLGTGSETEVSYI